VANISKNLIIPLLVFSSIVLVIYVALPHIDSSIEQLLNRLIHKPLIYTYLSLAILISDILIPIPSSIIMYLNGYVLGCFIGGFISLFSVMTGSIIGYMIGGFTSLGIKQIQKDSGANSLFRRYGLLAIIITRGIPILSESVCMLCGFNKVSFKDYFLYNLIGYIPVCWTYAYFGSIGLQKNIFFITFGVSIVISISFWLFGGLIINKRL